MRGARARRAAPANKTRKPERLVSIGSCGLLEARRLPRFVRGCPPNNVDIVRALIGGV